MGLDILMFLAAFLLLMAGFPVAFTLAGVALIFSFLGIMTGSFDSSFLQAFPQRIFGIMNNEILLAIPLFIFMGSLLERSRLAESLLTGMAYLLRHVRGGLGISVTIVGALLAASTGIVAATVVTMGLLSLPSLIKRGYDPAFATGTISAAGTLGQIIPPSIVLILLGDIISNAYQQSQLQRGIFAPETVSLGELFAGALLPGLALVGLYILYQFSMSLFRPHLCGHNQVNEDSELNMQTVLLGLIPPISLIIAVLGSILMGLATPTEAAGVGALGTILLAGMHIRKKENFLPQAGIISLLILLAMGIAFDFKLLQSPAHPLFWLSVICMAIFFVSLAFTLIALWKSNMLREVMHKTMEMNAMVFTLLIGAALFSLVLRGFGGDETVQSLLENMPGGAMGAMIGVMLVMFIMGFFLDFIEITLVIVPLIAPILLSMGYDPIWLGVMITINLQTSFLTPPFGFALFYLRSVAPKSIKTADIYKGVIPFIFIQLLMLGLLAYFPQMASFLPELIFD